MSLHRLYGENPEKARVLAKCPKCKKDVKAYKLVKTNNGFIKECPFCGSEIKEKDMV